MYVTSTSGYYPSKPCVAQITKKKNRLKVYPAQKDQVYLNDGDEFEIELFNPKTFPVLAKISINGKRISERGIILNPGQRVFLERFIDSPEKFKFSTYEVGNSKEVKEAIANNGLVKIEFYDEYTPLNLGGITWTNSTTPITYTNDYYYNGNPINLTGSGTTTNAVNSYFSNTSTFGSTFSGDLNEPLIGQNSCSTAKTFRSASLKSLETGRVEAGDKSAQKLEEGKGNFNTYYSNVVEYQILPISAKNVEAKEIRSYCTECGTRNKQDWKFCPTCGKKF